MVDLSLSPAGRLRVLLVGNYETDRQESMLRFGRLLRDELAKRGMAVDYISPKPFFGLLRRASHGVGKWLGYLDKYLLFPFQLRRRVAAHAREVGYENVVVHICDHSNAVYCGTTRARMMATCHDLLAVRGALGEDTDCPATRAGRVLQKLILQGLQRAHFIVCDSAATRADLLRLAPSFPEANSSVILLAQNHPYRRLEPAETRARLTAVPGLNLDLPFLLHVGSDLRRKNRDVVLKTVAELRDDWSGQVVFAGEPLGEESSRLARRLKLDDRIVQVSRPDNRILEALYNQAFALVFPSRCEGFGWPIIEAQACGCPVLASNRTSLPEVAGPEALLFDPDDVSGFADAVRRLQLPNSRERLVSLGLDNTRRFLPSVMIDEYSKIYANLRGRKATSDPLPYAVGAEVGIDSGNGVQR